MYKNSKKILFILLMILSIGNALAIDQIGIAYRYNGKKQRTPLGGVYIKVATSPNGVVSQEQNGQFVLKLKDIKMGDAMGNAIVQKTGMMVFNKEEVNRWHVQKGALVLIVCDVNEFQKQKAQLITIGCNQAKKKYKQKIEQLKAQNAKQQLSLDQYHAKLDSIEKEKENALAHMDEYADMFARIDESEVDTLAQRAIELFNQGKLEESIKLFEQGNYLEKLDGALKVVAQGENIRQKGESAVTEYTKSIQAQVAAYKMKNEWDKAGELLKAVADKLNNYEALMEFAVFSLEQNNYEEALKYNKIILNVFENFPGRNKSEDYLYKYSCVLNNMGLIYMDLHKFSESENMLIEAGRIDTKLADLNLVYVYNMFKTSMNLANLYYESNQYAKCEEIGLTILDTVQGWYKKDSKRFENDLLWVRNLLGQLYMKEKQYEKSLEMFSKNYGIQIVHAYSKNNNSSLITTCQGLARLFHLMGDVENSERFYEKVMVFVENQYRNNPDRFCLDYIGIRNNLGVLYNEKGKSEESLMLYKESIVALQKCTTIDSFVYNEILSCLYDNIGSVYYILKKYKDAEEYYDKSANLRLELFQSFKDEKTAHYVASTFNNIGLLNYEIKNYKKSENCYNLAYKIWKDLANKYPQIYESELARVSGNMANLYFKLERYKESEKMNFSIIEIFKRLAKTNPQIYESKLAKAYDNLGLVFYSTQRFAESEQMYTFSFAIYEQLKNNHPELYESKYADCLFLIADSKIRQNKYIEAINPLDKALFFYEKEGYKTSIENIDCYGTIIDWLIQIFDDENKFSSGYHCFKKHISILYSKYQYNKKKYTKTFNRTLISLAFYSIFEKQYAEAETYSRDALEVDSTKHIAYSNLAAALLFQGKYLEAEKIYRQYKAELKEGFLSDFEEFSKTGVIPKNREEDVEKIKQLLLKE